MARTAPVPNIPPIPGMCPSVAVMGGGAGGGGGGGAGAGGGGGHAGAGGGGTGEGAGGDGRSAASSAPNAPCVGGGGCGNPHTAYSAGDPIDVLTGRSFTAPVVDLELPGPMRFAFARHWDLRLRKKDAGLGPGWSHSFAWVVAIHRDHIDVTHPEGHSVRFDMAPSDSAGQSSGWSLRRDAGTFVLDAGDGFVRTLSPHPSDASRFVLTETRDRNGNRISLSWSAALVTATDSVGRVVELPLDGDGHFTSIGVVQPDGSVLVAARYLYADGLLASAEDADGFASRHAYGPAAELVQLTNRAGLETFWRYDDRLRCDETWQTIGGMIDASIDATVPKVLADGATPIKGAHHAKLTFDDAGMTEVATSLRVDRVFGDAFGRVYKTVVGGGVSTMAYEENGELAGATDPLGRTTTFEYAGRRVIKVTDPAGRVTTFDYDGGGNVVRVVLPNGGVEISEYDARGNLIKHTNAAGESTIYRYEARGLLVEEYRPDGSKVLVDYDAHGNAVRVQNELGGVFLRKFDHLGRRLEEADPAGVVSTAKVSPRGDVLSVTDANGTVTFTHDGERRLTAETDATGRVSTTAYGLGGIAETVKADGSRMKYLYDLEGDLVRVLNEDGEEYVLERDIRGHIVREKTFDGREKRYTNDAVGQMTRLVDADRSTHLYEYDALGRLVLHKLPSGEEIATEYDLTGEIALVARKRVQVRYERDVLGRILREAQIADGVEHWVKTTYDAGGEEARVETSAGHEREMRKPSPKEWQWILDGQKLIKRHYDVAGREVRRDLPLGGAIDQRHAPNGRLVKAQASVGGAPRLGIELRYDAAAQLAAVEVDGAITAVHYDAAARVDIFGKEEYRYSPADVLHEMGPNARPRRYEPGGRLVEHGSTKLEWNVRAEIAALERVNSGKAARDEYTFDALGYVSSVKTADGTLFDYVYDTLGRLLKKTAMRGPNKRVLRTVRYVWDADVPIHRIETSGSTRTIDTYAYDQQDYRLIATRRGGDAAWSLWVNDAIGAPMAELGEDGSTRRLVSRSAYAIDPVGARDGDPGLLGQIWDDDLGVYLNRHRLYEPESGTYLKADPFGLAGGAHLFGYPDDPLLEADPLGLAFSKKTRETALDRARDDDGRVRCQNGDCNVLCTKPKKSMSGVTPRQDEWQFDHKKPRAKGGTDSLRNCTVLCRKCNRAKSDKY